MGRRAKKAPVQTKKRPTLAKRFKCPFCANDEVVECKMDFKAGIGSLACRLCGASYQMPIHHLHEPVDVFSEWLDDCEAAAQGKPTNTASHETSIPRYEEDTDEEDDDQGNLPAPSGLKSSKPASSANATGGARPSYTDLGLDDSDDDSDED